MAYTDLATIQDTDPGDILTAAWCDQVRDNQEFFVDPPACSVFASSSQTVSDDTQTILTADSEFFDNDSMHSTVSNTSRITAQTGGRYLLIATVGFDPDTDGRRNVSYLANGADVLTGMAMPAVTDGAQRTIATIVRMATLAAGEYVEARCIHTAGANLDVELIEFAATFLTR